MRARQVRSLGYVRIGMRDPNEWAEMGERILGLAAQPQDDGSVHLRLDTESVRFIVEQAPEDGFVCAGWEVGADHFAAISDALAKAGVAVSVGSEAECAKRFVGAFRAARDPSGNLFEYFRSRTGSGRAFSSPIDGVGFVAGQLGLGHVVLPALQHQATSEFYQSIFGFGMSDELTLPPPMADVPEMCIHFLHAQSARHHSLGLLNGPAASGVVHLMVEMTSLDAVGACLDRVNEANLPITATLGRHANDGMVSFYFLAPGGIPVEVGYDGLQFDWEDFVPTQSTIGDLWGHAYSFPE